ncbi:MAG: DUF4440 domain-containing protein [Anaerolineales bacterium]
MSLKKFGKQEIDQFTHEFEELFDVRDYRGLASYYASDAKLLPEDMEVVQGHAALEHFWHVSCEGAKKKGLKRTIQVQNFESSGDLGYLTGIVTLRIPETDGESLINKVRYITVWRRENDRAWRIIIDISNRQP